MISIENSNYILYLCKWYFLVTGELLEIIRGRCCTHSCRPALSLWQFSLVFIQYIFYNGGLWIFLLIPFSWKFNDLIFPRLPPRLRLQAPRVRDRRHPRHRHQRLLRRVHVPVRPVRGQEAEDQEVGGHQHGMGRVREHGITGHHQDKVRKAGTIVCRQFEKNSQLISLWFFK